MLGFICSGYGRFGWLPISVYSRLNPFSWSWREAEEEFNHYRKHTAYRSTVIRPNTLVTTHVSALPSLTDSEIYKFLSFGINTVYFEEIKFETSFLIFPVYVHKIILISSQHYAERGDRNET